MSDIKMPESQAEYREIDRCVRDVIESARLTLWSAQVDFDRACNEYAEWKRECRKKGFR